MWHAHMQTGRRIQPYRYHVTCVVMSAKLFKLKTIPAISHNQHEAHTHKLAHIDQARGSHKVLAGMLDVSTHMAVIQTRNGGFLVIDTIQLTPDLRV